MLVHKGFRFRAYPDDGQRERLAAWFGCERFVSNLAIDQRRMFSRRCRSINYSMQAADPPALRAGFPWLADCPNQILQQSLRHVDRAYRNFFEGRASYPRKRRKFERDSFKFPALEQRQVLKKDGEVVLGDDGEPFWIKHTIVDLLDGSIDLPKIGRIRWIRHRKLQGTPRSVTVSREGGMYFVSVLCAVEVDVSEAQAPTQEVEAFDYGIRQDYTTTDGSVFDVPGITPGESKRRRVLELDIGRRFEARRVREREARKAGALGPRERLPQSCREKGARHALRALDARLVRRAHDALHKFTTGLVRRAAVVGYEDLDVRSMTASAKGTQENPGSGVARKSGLNRGLLHGRPGTARLQVEYKALWSGRRAVAVPPRFTSQYCSSCGCHPKDDALTAHLPHGRDGAGFTCPLCGFTCDADRNAAVNIGKAALRLAALPDQDRPPTRREKKRSARKGGTSAGGHSVAARGALAKEQATNRELPKVAKAA